MPKLVIDIKGKPLNGDILVFKGGEFVPSDIRFLLPELQKIKELEDRIEKLEKEIKLIKGE